MNKFCHILSDFGEKDNFVGVMKGVILKICPDAKITDICNNIPHGDINKASFMLEAAFDYMPRGVYLCVVDPGVGISRKAVVIKYRGSYFVGPDNGIFTYFINKGALVYEIKMHKYIKNVSNTFHGRDIFAPTTAALLKGVKINKLARKFAKNEKPVLLKSLPLKKGTHGISGILRYIDTFGNLITNIPKKFLKGINNDTITLEIKTQKKVMFYKSYGECDENILGAIVGSSGFVEIFLNKKSASNMLSAKEGDDVKITFSQKV